MGGMGGGGGIGSMLGNVLMGPGGGQMGQGIQNFAQSPQGQQFGQGFMGGMGMSGGPQGWGQQFGQMMNPMGPFQGGGFPGMGPVSAGGMSAGWPQQGQRPQMGYGNWGSGGGGQPPQNPYGKQRADYSQQLGQAQGGQPQQQQGGGGLLGMAGKVAGSALNPIGAVGKVFGGGGGGK